MDLLCLTARLSHFIWKGPTRQCHHIGHEDDPPPVEDVDGVGEFERHRHVLLDEQHRDPLVGDLPDYLPVPGRTARRRRPAPGLFASLANVLATQNSGLAGI